MAIIAHRFSYKFEQHKINLCGSMTTIQLIYTQNDKTNPKKELYYGAGGEERFNTALEFFLVCLDDLKREVESRISQYSQSANDDRASKAIVYHIKDNTINNISIRWKYSES